MLTKEYILEQVKEGRQSQTLDSRDYSRLSDYFEEEHLGTFEFKLKEGATHTVTDFTQENILKQLETDLEFAFEKALNKRGLSAGMMHEVILMWMWVLEDDLQHLEDYGHYGLPLFKAVAVKYGFDNPIGDDEGSEDKYGSVTLGRNHER